MVVIFSNKATDEEIQTVVCLIETQGFEAHISRGVQRTIVGAIGVRPDFDTRIISVLDGVEDVIRVTAPYKLASRSFHEEDSILDINGIKIGGRHIAMMAGPCSIESEDQIDRLAEIVAKSGAKFLRGGAFKPRSSPYSFQGLGEKGLKLLQRAAQKNGLLSVTEVMQIDQIGLIEQYADMLQVGARNMQNFSLLKELGKSRLPVLLKRGLSATIEEWLMSAEYILSNGNPNVILCERGIRTFEKYTRNTFDISSIPVIHRLSHLPVIADPSHALGIREQVPPMARAAVAAGADGLMIEIHEDPKHALSDGPQALLPADYLKLIEELRAISSAIGRTI